MYRTTSVQSAQCFVILFILAGPTNQTSMMPFHLIQNSLFPQASFLNGVATAKELWYFSLFLSASSTNSHFPMLPICFQLSTVICGKISLFLVPHINGTLDTHSAGCTIRAMSSFKGAKNNVRFEGKPFLILCTDFWCPYCAALKDFLCALRTEQNRQFNVRKTWYA